MLNENLLKDDNIGMKSMGKNQIFQYIQDFDVENHQWNLLSYFSPLFLLETNPLILSNSSRECSEVIA